MTNLPELDVLNRRLIAELGIAKDWYFDNLVSFACGKPSLDIVKVDDALQKQYPDYVDGVSMKDFITARFGEETADWVRDLI